MRDPLMESDPIAERRYAYAKAAALEGDWSAALDVLNQTLERAPEWAAAWFALGEAKEKLGDLVGACDAFRETLRLDRADSQGAEARLALMGEGETPIALPPAYVARLFDDYAPRFATHLTADLIYRGPELVVAALDKHAPGRRFARCLDLGCGTGLAGAALRPRVDRLVGVDISPGMILQAERIRAYDALEIADIVAFLQAQPPESADLIVAADVLIYLGDLAPVLAALARVLARDGLSAFSLESGEGEAFRLAASMRFKHSLGHVRDALAGSGLEAIFIAEQSARREAGVDVPGWLALVGPSRAAREGSPH